ncbi:MAG: Glu-tRNA(Gln) amidotransferase subunit GatD [bacterium]|nr:Glu-tRNA(Gln) amidotransferase subunit GatD [bacterium]
MSDADDFPGYREPTLSILRRFDTPVWSDIRAHTTRGLFEGLILPRAETADEAHISLKLVSGYNVGLRHDTIESIEKVGYRPADYRVPEEEFPFDPDKPRVILFGTGGTIASRLDYRTGAVIPAFSPGELYGSVPELADVCNLVTEKLFGVFSENIDAGHWKILAERCGQAIEDGYQGIVIGHGTDTMHHTAAALTYMVADSPIPIVLVGSQRSSDRPSSDAAQSLINASSVAAHGDIAEVLVCMFGPTSERYNLLHRGTRVRKMHSSFRSTFRTLGDVPLAMIEKGKIDPIKHDYVRRDPTRTPDVQPYFEDKTTLLYYYPNMQPDILHALIDNGYKGIILAGTGLGHVNSIQFEALERARDEGVQVYMTLQTLWGFVQMYVYETGREILERGVVPLANMLPEVAYVKLGWALGRWPNEPEKVREFMTTPVHSDMTAGEPVEGYLVFQGGVPEVQDFLKTIWS